MRMKDDDIQKKLVELESAIVSENTQLAKRETSSELTNADFNIRRELPGSKVTSSPGSKSDLQYFGGMGLVMIGLFMLLQHVQVTNRVWSFGFLNPSNSMGILLVPLLIGIGWVFYNSKSVWGWLLTVLSLVLMLFTIITGLYFYFPVLSLLQSIIMLSPIAIGLAFMLKGMGGPKGVDTAIRKRIAESNQSQQAGE